MNAMRNSLALVLVAAVPLAMQQDARSVLQTAATMQAAREASVNNYTVIQSVGGIETPAYYEKTEIGGHQLFRLVEMGEWQAKDRSNPNATLAPAAPMADGLDMVSGALGAEMSKVPGGGMFASVLTGMMDTMSIYLRFAADVEIGDGKAEATAGRNGMAVFAQRARLVGRETVAGKPAFHLRADDVSDIVLEQPANGANFALVDGSIWFDAAEYVPVRLLMNGTMTADGKKTPISIELLQLDYERTGSLYMPRRHVMRLSGLTEAMTTDPKQRRDLEKARRDAAKMQGEMAQMNEQLAELPASTRQMIEGRMKQAMAQLDQLLSGGAVEAEVAFRVRGVNQGPPLDWVPGKPNKK
jgi:hypothetical protein